MPGISGEETCRRIKASPSLRTVPVILLSARSELDERLQAGVADIVVTHEDDAHVTSTYF